MHGGLLVYERRPEGGAKGGVWLVHGHSARGQELAGGTSHCLWAGLVEGVEGGMGMPRYW